MAEEKSWIGARRMLRQLRDAMAGHGSAQDRLDRITQLIARGMVAEVCSVYTLRPGDILELFATEGLRKDAVHRTRLRIGEGLVGDIAAYARPLALSDAQAHPQFAYRPETGEEIFHSLLGVPILQGDGSSAFWLCRTNQSGSMPKKRPRHWRPLLWFWLNWLLVGSLFGRRN